MDPSVKNKERKLKFVSSFLIMIRDSCVSDRCLRIHFFVYLYYLYILYLCDRKDGSVMLHFSADGRVCLCIFTCITRSLPCLAYYYTRYFEYL